MAQDIYKALLLVLGFLLGVGGFLDFALYLGGQETVCSWLRDHPLWFWIPAGLMVLFLAWMALHLTLQGETQ